MNTTMTADTSLDPQNMVSMSYRVAALFVTLVASSIGIMIPLYSSYTNAESVKSSLGFSIMRTFSAGIMVGVAFIHLLSDASNNLGSVYPDYSSLAFTLCTVGIVFVLTLENVVLSIVGLKDPSPLVSLPVHDHERHEHSHQHEHQHHDHETDGDCNANCEFIQENELNQSIECDGKLCKDVTTIVNDIQKVSAAAKFKVDGVSVAKVGTTVSCEHSHALTMVLDAKGLMVLIKAYLVEVAIATHSVIIGFSLGLMGDDQLNTLKALIAAISFHQFFEGLGLGAIISHVRLRLGPVKVIIFALVFSTTIAVGIALGIIVSLYQSGDSDARAFTTGCANALASGTLIYIALVEMIAEDFSHESIRGMKPTQKYGMILAFAAGIFVMAILAIWA